MNRRRWWLWVVLPVVLLLSGYLISARAIEKGKTAGAEDRGTAGPPGPRAIPVVAAVARTGDLPVYLDALGTVTASQTVTVRTRVDGQLVRVNFREGQLVHEGDLLAEIDPRPFEVQLTQAQGQLARDQAALQNAKLDLDRYQALFARDAVPRQQLDTQAATVNQFEGAIRIDQGQIDSARLNLTYAHIKAPLTGRVGLRLVDPGNMVHAADQNGLVVITQVQPIALLFAIPEDSLPQVQAQTGRGRTLAVEAWDHDLRRKLATGTLLTTDNEVDPATATVKLKALFENRDDALFPNQFVNARLLVDTLHDVVIVPAAAVQRGAQSTFVWVVGANGAAEMKPCTVGRVEGDQAALASGVTAGEAVVVDGVDRLQQGTKVAAQPPPGGRPGAGRPSGAGR